MKEQTIKSNKIQLSLAAILFFSLLVRKLLRENSMELDTQAKKFVESYILYGYAILILSGLTIIGTIAYYFIPSQIIYRLHTTGAIVIVLAIIVGIAAVFSDSQIIKKEQLTAQHKPTTIEAKNILSAYIPVYNIYMWYKLHNFEKPYRRAKESILLRTFFVIATLLIQSPIFSVIIIIAIVARVATLIGEVDIMHGDIQRHMNTRFYKNPEELWGYITGIVMSAIHYSKSHIRETTETIKKHKNIYQELLPIKNTQTIIEISIATVLLIRRVATRAQTLDVWIYYVAVGIILGRYLILGRKRKHLPHIPVIYEILEGIKMLLNRYIPKDI